MNVITNYPIQCTVAMAALESVIDPEIGLNVADLGLIYQLDFDEPGNKLHCAMTLTTQFCPMGESITNAAKNVLQNTFPRYEIVMKLIFDPPWNPEMISEEGRSILNA